MDPLEVLKKVVRAAHKDRFIASQIENNRDCPMFGFGHNRFSQTIVVIEIYLGVGEAVRIQSPFRARAVGTDGLTEQQEVCLRRL